MTHAELVERAGRWLRNTCRCKLVILEPKPWNCHEHVDAIGWTPEGESIVVECKVSLTDFKSDWNKPWRRNSIGMGFRRYYLTPPYLLTRQNQTWKTSTLGAGLLEVHGRCVKVVCEADYRQLHDFTAETNLLVAHICGGKSENNVDFARAIRGRRC